MYDELVKRLREATEKSVCGECGLNLCTGATKKGVLFAEAADALLKSLPRWIPVTERLPETGHDVLVKFPQNMAVASIDIGEWVVNSGDGWCTDINLAGGEKNPTHWMELPEPPKEEE